MSTVPARQRWLVPVLALVVALTAGGGLVAQDLYSSDPSGDPDTGSGTVSTPSSVPRRQQPGPTQVQLTPGVAAHPYGREVGALLQDYFDAINQRDYRLWTTTVTARWVRMKPEAAWREGYRSTHDGNILIYRIDTLARGKLRVLFGFTSTQRKVDAPRSLPVRCIRWHAAFPVVSVNGERKLDKASDRAAPEGTKCAA